MKMDNVNSIKFQFYDIDIVNNKYIPPQKILKYL